MEEKLEKKKNKKKRIIIGIVPLILLILVIGISYAAFYYNFLGTDNLINVEPIELKLLESTDEIINIENALPMSDAEGIAQSETFDFAVTTRTRAVTNIYYNLKIEKLSVDSGYTSLQDNDIKIYLTDWNDKALIAPRKIGNLNDYIIYKTYNSHSKEANEVTTKFKLKTWIDQDVDVSNWTENTSFQYKFKIGVDGDEYKSTLVNLEQGSPLPEGAFYANLNMETGALTQYEELPETPNEYDIYVYGDYGYLYSAEEVGGWMAVLASELILEQLGLTGLFPSVQLVDLTRTSFEPMLESINGAPVTAMSNTFMGATNLAEPPVVPKNVFATIGIFEDCISLKSDTNIYSYTIGDLYSGSTLDTIANYTTNYKSLDKPVFLKHNIGSLGRIETQEVCYILNGEKHCLKGGADAYYEENKSLLLETFGEDNCSVYSNSVYCSLSGLYAYAHDYGYVSAYTSDWDCNVYSHGDACCGE